jgi:hypothetical protein
MLEIAVLVQATQWALLFGGALWLLYVALEPHVRKRWPAVLVSWNRVLAGRWNDPLVGRDVLVGMAASAVSLALNPLAAWAARRAGEDAPVTVDLSRLMGARFAAAELIEMVCTSVLGGLMVLFVLLFFRLIVRRDGLAYLLLAAAAGLVVGTGPATAILGFVGASIMLVIVRRWGLVSLISATLASGLATPTLFASQAPGLAASALVMWASYVALGLWAARAVLQGRSIVGAVLGEGDRTPARAA